MPDLTVVVLTYNEALHIRRAIQSVKEFASRVVVVDSFSTDKTVDIASEEGAEVVQHPFENYARQFQWALDNLAIDSDWVMRLDADEMVGKDLAKEICDKLPNLSRNICGIELLRRHIFLGRWIRHGGRYPLVLLRIWRRDSAYIENRWMDEHMVLRAGESIQLTGDFSDWNLRDLTFFTDKHNKYATREAVDVILSERELLQSREDLRGARNAWQTRVKRLLKDDVYSRFPIFIGPFAYFLFRYFLQLGFLDGAPGLIYHFLQGFWYRFLVQAKVFELERSLVGLAPSEVKGALSRLTGLKVE